MFIERVRASLRKAAEGTVEVLYPRRCSGCGLRGVWVCDACLTALPLYRSASLSPVRCPDRQVVPLLVCSCRNRAIAFGGSLRRLVA